MFKKLILFYILTEISNLHSFKMEERNKCINIAKNSSNIIINNIDKYEIYEIYHCIYNNNNSLFYKSYCKDLYNYEYYLYIQNNCMIKLKISIIISYITIFIFITMMEIV